MRIRRTALSQIKDAYEDSRLIPFIGSGFSASVAPKWDDFIEELFKGEKEVFEEINDNLELLEYYVITKKKKSLLEKIDKTLTFNVKTELGKPSSVTKGTKEILLKTHDLLCEKFKDQIIYTTNWDNLIEDVGGFNKFTNRIDTLSSGCKKGVIKFHGSVGMKKDKTGDELVACKSDYWQRISNITPFDILFQSDYVKNYYLFIGYSLRDINVSLTIYQLMKLINSNRKKNKEKRIFWAVAEPRGDKRVKVLSNHSNIVPYFLLTKKNELVLKNLKKESKSLCDQCKIENLAKIKSLKSLKGIDVCKECPSVNAKKKEYEDEWKKFIEHGTIKLLKNLKHNYNGNRLIG